jgi:hypothetical protein
MVVPLVGRGPPAGTSLSRTGTRAGDAAEPVLGRLVHGPKLDRTGTARLIRCG